MVFIDHSDLCKQTIEPTLIAKSHPKTIENMISPDKRLTVVKNIASNKITDHSLKTSQLQRMVPENMQSLKKKLAKQALQQSRSNVSTNESYMALVDELKKNSLPFREVYGVNGEVTAIFYHDPVIAPENIEFIFILTSDVTHGVFDSKCGYKKLGLWCGIDAAKHIKPLGN